MESGDENMQCIVGEHSEPDRVLYGLSIVEGGVRWVQLCTGV